jgi:hypothetical protein
MRLLSYVACDSQWFRWFRWWNLHFVHVIVTFTGDSGIQHVKSAGKIAKLAKNASFRAKHLQFLQVKVRIFEYKPDLPVIFAGTHGDRRWPT